MTQKSKTASTKRKKTKALPPRSALEAAYRQAVARFVHRSEVRGVDIGRKVVDGVPTSQLVVRVLIVEKLARRLLNARELIPKRLDGVDTDIIQANHRTQAAVVVDATAGGSVGLAGYGAGTLGLVVKQRSDGRIGVLSAGHVLAPDGSGKGDAVFAPAPLDANTVKAIATLERRSNLDAALALVGPGISLDRRQGGKVLCTRLSDPFVDRVLHMHGRTTPSSVGVVDGEGLYREGSDTELYKAFRVAAPTGNNASPPGTAVAQAGDSGAVWYDPKTREAVGLHIMGSVDDYDRPYAIAVRLRLIATEFEIDLA